MTTLKRILGWWAVYAASAWVLAMSMALPLRMAHGYSIGDALGSALTSYFPMMTLTLVPAFVVLFIWALVLERRPRWEQSDLSLVASSGIMAVLIALGVGLLGVDPGFAWRTGSYAGDAAGGAMAYLATAWLCLLLTRLVVRKWTVPPPRTLESAPA